MNPTVKEMVKAYLEEHGFDGLVNKRGDCSCTDDCDLDTCPEGLRCLSCQAGYKVACTPDCEHDFDYREGNWHIQAEKPAPEKEAT